MNATGKARVVGTDELGDLGADIAFVEACFNEHFDQVARIGFKRSEVLRRWRDDRSVQNAAFIVEFELVEDHTARRFTHAHAGASTHFEGNRLRIALPFRQFTADPRAADKRI